MLFKEPWQPGMFCLSIYKEDGEAYEGLVKSIEGSEADGGQYAVVQFIGKSPFEIFFCASWLVIFHYTIMQITIPLIFNNEESFRRLLITLVGLTWCSKNDNNFHQLL